MRADRPDRVEPPASPKRRQRLLVLQTSSLLEAYGGIEYYLDDLLDLAVDACGTDAAWAVVPQRIRTADAWQTRYRHTAVPYPSSGALAKLENRVPLRMLKAARAIAHEYRPTLLVSGHVSLGPLAYLLSRLTGVPYVTIAYGLEAWGNLFPQDEWCLARSKAIFSISHWTKRVLVQRGYLEKNVHVVQPMLPRGFEKLPAPRERERPAGKPLTLLTVSRLDAGERYKGQDHVLEALRRIRASEPGLELRYVIQGDGSDRARLEGLVREWELDDIVEFRPKVAERKEFENVYREADVFVMPSRYGRWEGRWRGEGFGIVYLEAAAFGVPSVAYDCGGATDVIRQGENGVLVPPDDIGELARQLASLARHPRKVAEMGKRAHAAVMRDFTRAAIRRQLVRALDSL